MNIKKATPSTSAASNITNNPNISLSRAPYQLRCLKALLLGSINRNDLDGKVGTSNSPEFVRQLRSKGLIIHLEKISFINRDGRKKWHGRYCLDDSSKQAAKAMLGICSD